MSKETIYISGPMTGIDDYNYPEFERHASEFRSDGIAVISPHEITPEFGLPYSHYMKRDIAALLLCDAIIMLDGWENSRGAKLEREIAIACGLRVSTVQEEALRRLKQ